MREKVKEKEIDDKYAVTVKSVYKLERFRQHTNLTGKIVGALPYKPDSIKNQFVA